MIKQHLIQVLILVYMITISSYVVAESADQIVFDTTEEVLNRLQVDRNKLAKEPEYIKTIIRELIIPHMDFITMSELVLGNKWNELNQNKKECFSNGFKNLLVERYAYILLSYKQQNISYQSAKPIGEKGNVSIMQTLTREGVKPLVIEYPMRPDENSWKVIDLVIDDVSLIRNYRKMFNKEIKHTGLENFVGNFQECN
ncbi:MAG: ABC transporter substrate-binding protein [Proteobacteria bacterium]|nr:ABC transporter substrate-binding protein [Pseudomonadota bacterium]